MKCYNCSKKIEELEICPYCKKNQIYTTLEFNVNGVTFKNEEGKDIQKEIRSVFLEYEKNGIFEKYGGYTNEEIKEFVTEVSEFEDAKIQMQLKEDTYENKPCVKIYIRKYNGNYCHVGYMPKELVKKYQNLKNSFRAMNQDINLVGGKIKQVQYDILTDKEEIQTIELTYGFEVKLTFYNDKEKLKEEIAKNNAKRMEQLKKSQEEQKIRDEKYRKINQKNNIKAFIIIAIISIPFIWLLWKILNFVFWIITI